MAHLCISIYMYPSHRKWDFYLTCTLCMHPSCLFGCVGLWVVQALLGYIARLSFTYLIDVLKRLSDIVSVRITPHSVISMLLPPRSMPGVVFPRKRNPSSK